MRFRQIEQSSVIIFLAGSLFVVAMLYQFFLSSTARILSSIQHRVDGEDVTIVAFGDSLTAGQGLPGYEAYPAILERRLRAQGVTVRVENEGKGGESTLDILERANIVRSQNPDIVLLGIGVNDARKQLSLEETKSNIVATINVLQGGENPPVVVLLKMQAPRSANESYKESFHAMYQAIADEKQILLVPFITERISSNQAYRLPDGIHFNESGYAIAVDSYILPVVNSILREF